MPKKNYQGFLLAANPSNPKDDSNKSVILLISQTNKLSLGLQLNYTVEGLTVGSVCKNMGIDYHSYEPVYYGGSSSCNKIHIVHSLDWQGMTTLPINEQIGVTNDVSILTAISEGVGPEYYRTCAGGWIWENGEIEEQTDPHSNAEHRWEVAPATIETIFERQDGYDQWRSILEESARFQIAHWL